MKKLLYIGNKLSKHGSTTTSIETLGVFLEQEGYTVFYASSKKNKLFRLLDMVFKTLRYSKKVEYVLIDVYSTQNFWYAFIVSQLCRVLNMKYIAKLHGGNLPNRLKNSPFFCKRLFCNANVIIAPSNYLMDSFSKFGFENLNYIPNTIEIDNYNFNSRPTLVPKLLWVRSFSAIYNPKMAITVLSLLKKDYPQAELCMIGPDSGAILEDCKKYAKALSVEVNFIGKLSKEEWIKVSEEYTIFINTTHFDNMPVSVMEAMALGLPVVSTNVGGIPFLIEQEITGLLIDDSDAEAMVLAIKRLILDSKLKDNIVTNARKSVENFDWNLVKNKWLELLK